MSKVQVTSNSITLTFVTLVLNEANFPSSGVKRKPSERLINFHLAVPWACTCRFGNCKTAEKCKVIIKKFAIEKHHNNILKLTLVIALKEFQKKVLLRHRKCIFI